jgi:hypothetical protein
LQKWKIYRQILKTDLICKKTLYKGSKDVTKNGIKLNLMYSNHKENKGSGWVFTCRLPHAKPQDTIWQCKCKKNLGP